MRRFFFLQNSPVDCFLKPKELTELETGRSQFVRAGVQRVQPFVHGYRECNIPVQVKAAAKFAGLAASSLLHLRGNFAKIGGKRIETDKAQWQSRKKWNL